MLLFNMNLKFSLLKTNVENTVRIELKVIIYHMDLFIHV